MPPAISGQSLLTFPDILQPGGESYSEPGESDGHKTGFVGDAMEDVRQCARTHLCAFASGDTTPSMESKACEIDNMTQIPPPSTGLLPGLPLLKRRLDGRPELSEAHADRSP